jgi:hypothetical protein
MGQGYEEQFAVQGYLQQLARGAVGNRFEIIGIVWPGRAGEGFGARLADAIEFGGGSFGPGGFSPPSPGVGVSGEFGAFGFFGTRVIPKIRSKTREECRSLSDNNLQIILTRLGEAATLWRQTFHLP